MFDESQQCSRRVLIHGETFIGGKTSFGVEPVMPPNVSSETAGVQGVPATASGQCATHVVDAQGCCQVLIEDKA